MISLPNNFERFTFFSPLPRRRNGPISPAAASQHYGNEKILVWCGEVWCHVAQCITPCCGMVWYGVAMQDIGTKKHIHKNQIPYWKERADSPLVSCHITLIENWDISTTQPFPLDTTGAVLSQNDWGHPPEIRTTDIPLWRLVNVAPLWSSHKALGFNPWYLIDWVWLNPFQHPVTSALLIWMQEDQK